MKKLYFIGNIIFFCLVVHFIGQSVSVYMGKKKMKISLMETERNIKELKERKQTVSKLTKNHNSGNLKNRHIRMSEETQKKLKKFLENGEF